MDMSGNNSPPAGPLRTPANGMSLVPAGPSSLSTLCPLSLQVGMELALLAARVHKRETASTPSAPQPAGLAVPTLAASEEGGQLAAHGEELPLSPPIRVIDSMLSPSQAPVGPNEFELSRGGGLLDLENFLNSRLEAVASTRDGTNSSWAQLLSAYGFPNPQSSRIVEQLLHRAIQSTRRVDPMLERRQALAPSAFLNNIILGVCLECTVAVASNGEQTQSPSQLQQGGGDLLQNGFPSSANLDSRPSSVVAAQEAEPLAEQMRIPERVSNSSSSSGSSNSSNQPQQLLQQSGATPPLVAEEQLLGRLRLSGPASPIPPPTVTVDPASEDQENRRGENAAPMVTRGPSSDGETAEQGVGSGSVGASLEETAERRDPLAPTNGRDLPATDSRISSAPAQPPTTTYTVSLDDLEWNAAQSLAYLPDTGRVMSLDEARRLPPGTRHVSIRSYHLQHMRGGAFASPYMSVAMTAGVAAGVAAAENNRDRVAQYNQWEAAPANAPLGAIEHYRDFEQDTESETTWGSETSEDTAATETPEVPVDDDLEGAPGTDSSSLAETVFDFEEDDVFDDASDSEEDAATEGQSEAEFDVALEAESGAEGDGRGAVAAGDPRANAARDAEAIFTDMPSTQGDMLNGRLTEQQFPSDSVYISPSQAPPHNSLLAEGFPSGAPSSRWALEHEDTRSDGFHGALSNNAHVEQRAVLGQREEQEGQQQLEQEPSPYYHLSPMPQEEDAHQSLGHPQQQQTLRASAELNRATENTAAATSSPFPAVLSPPTPGRETASPADTPLREAHCAVERFLPHRSAPASTALGEEDSNELYPEANPTRNYLVPQSHASEDITTDEVPEGLRLLRDPANTDAAQMFWDSILAAAGPPANTMHSNLTPTSEASQDSSRRDAGNLLRLLFGPAVHPPFNFNDFVERRGAAIEGSVDRQRERGFVPPSTESLQDSPVEDNSPASPPPAPADSAERGRTSLAGPTSSADSEGGNTEAGDFQGSQLVQEQAVYQLIHTAGNVVETLGRSMHQLLDIMEFFLKRENHRN